MRLELIAPIDLLSELEIMARWGRGRGGGGVTSWSELFSGLVRVSKRKTSAESGTDNEKRTV